MENTKIEKSKSYTPTEAMRNNAKRGLALREKYNRGGLSTSEASKEGVGSGVARARDIINGDLSLNTVKRMYAFFLRHEKNYQPKKKEADGGPTAGTIAWLQWGGSSGLAWARSILRQEGILKSHTQEITKSELEQEDNIPNEQIQIAKSLDQELMQVTYVAMKADFTDAHGDYTSSEEVRKAKESFNKNLLKKQTMSNLFHMFETTAFDVIESYLAPADMSLNGHFVQKGDWLMTLQINDESLWEMVKKGEVVGLSIGASANVEKLEEE